MHVGKFGTYDNNSTHGFINRTAVTWGLGVLQPHMSLHTMEMYTKVVGKIDPKKNNNNSGAEGEKNSLLLPSINPRSTGVPPHRNVKLRLNHHDYNRLEEIS